MGRPPVGKAAMTGAERVRRWREARVVTKPVTKPQPSDAHIQDAEKRAVAAEERAARAEAEVEKLRKTLSDKPRTELELEIAKLRKQLRESRGMLKQIRYGPRVLPHTMPRADYMKFVKALHPDRINNVSVSELNEAFKILDRFKGFLTNKREP